MTPEARKKMYTQITERKARLKDDPEFLIMESQRRRIYEILRKNHPGVSIKTRIALGGSTELWISHIESQFVGGMNWKIRRWEFDHKIPLYTASSLDELIALFHYSNLRPLFPELNRFRLGRPR